MGNPVVQATYNLDTTLGVAGQLMSSEEGTVIESKPAAAYIPFGAAVQLASDGKSVQVLQNTGAGVGAMRGVSLYIAAREQAYGSPGQAGYAQYDMVPILRKGSVLALWSGTTQTPGTKPNVWHSSDASHAQGVFTDAGTSTTAGAEVANAPNGCEIKADATAGQFGATGLVRLDLNLPAG